MHLSAKIIVSYKAFRDRACFLILAFSGTTSSCFVCTTFVKQCLIEETCTKRFNFWVGLVMFFNLMTLDTKYGGGHFGQNFNPVVILFGISHPCFLVPPCISKKI